jgi:UDP-2,3-diacylglucosamine pyrophosphatase LpxH
MIQSEDYKRAYIASAIQRYPISSDIRFVSTISHLIQNDANLDSVISDINNYRQSFLSKKITTEQWITDSVQSWDKSLFVTLTFKRLQESNEALKHYDSFKHRVSKDIFRNAYKRNTKLIESFAVEEGDNDQIRKHLHAIMKVPEQMSVEKFAELLQQKWIYGHIHYYEMYGEPSKSIGYLLKDRSKSFITDDVVHF